MNGELITVSQLNKYIASVIAGDINLKSLFVSGEISNLKVNSFSGHIYLTLKDENAAVRAVMFRSNAVRLKFLPKEGMKVICRCSAGVYEKDGQYQLYINDIQPYGVGDIAIAFRQLTEKLNTEGLFDAGRKKPLPAFPRKIAVITSDTGAAVHDMINVISRRWPVASLLMCPAAVQGEQAAGQLCDAVIRAGNTDCDVIIIGRGGGSAEDLWCFNDEKLARTIAASKKPVISAVGHETDFTICDFVSDMRAPTPSAAAEIAVPDINEVRDRITALDSELMRLTISKFTALSMEFDSICSRKAFTDKFDFVRNKSDKLSNLYTRFLSAFRSTYSNTETLFTGLTSKLDALSPTKVLLRGYTIAEINGKCLKSSGEISTGDSIKIFLSDGTADCEVLNVERNI